MTDVDYAYVVERLNKDLAQAKRRKRAYLDSMDSCSHLHVSGYIAGLEWALTLLEGCREEPNGD